MPNREDRQKVMSAFFGALGKFRGTFGATLNAQVQSDMFYARARDYTTALEAALDGPNIPTSVYTRLVDGVNQHLPTFHRYLKLRQKMMGCRTCTTTTSTRRSSRPSDLTYTPDEAQKHVLAALQAARPRLHRRRHAAPSTSAGSTCCRPKASAPAPTRTAAPTTCTRTCCINYNGKYTDVSTLAHELGHTMQSYFSNKTQPFATANYPIFVAEVASTFNEALLIDYMLKKIKDDATKLSLLGNYLEGIKSTVFRQTQFAEFELRAHEMAEKGEPITGEALDKLYADITRKYYGHDKGVCIVDDYIAHEWAFIPHFYRNFYVFQYATSFTASAALSEKVMAGDPGGDQALPDVPDRRRLEVSDRPAQGRRRRHDDRRAARADDEEDEPRDGRDGEAAGREKMSLTAAWRPLSCGRRPRPAGSPGPRSAPARDWGRRSASAARAPSARRESPRQSPAGRTTFDPPGPRPRGHRPWSYRGSPSSYTFM